MNHKYIGHGLIWGGVVLTIAEGYAGVKAQQSGTPFEQGTIGKMVTPIEKYLPISLGVALVLTGVGLLWVYPWVRSKV